jgi:hypothetical protein
MPVARVDTAKPRRVTCRTQAQSDKRRRTAKSEINRRRGTASTSRDRNRASFLAGANKADNGTIQDNTAVMESMEARPSRGEKAIPRRKLRNSATIVKRIEVRRITSTQDLAREKLTGL